MGLIDFLEGAYKGGRLLFLLYDHDKQVKLRYKAIKGSGIKRLPNLSGVIVSESINHAEKQALVNNIPKRKSALDEEIELCSNLGYYVDVYTPTNTVDPVEIRVSSKDLSDTYAEICYLYHPYTSTADKVKKIKRLRKRLWEHIKEENSPKPHYELPSNGITSHYADVSGGTFGAIGGLASMACESLIKVSNTKRELEQRRMELTRKEWDLLNQNLNRHEKK